MAVVRSIKSVLQLHGRSLTLNQLSSAKLSLVVGTCFCFQSRMKSGNDFGRNTRNPQKLHMKIDGKKQEVYITPVKDLKWEVGELVYETEDGPRITDVEVSKDPKEWACVERLMPLNTVPSPPLHASYPTPSGWVPPAAKTSLPYSVKRTRYHQMPVYREHKRLFDYYGTKVTKIQGDIWAFEADLRKFCEGKLGEKVLTQVHEVGCFVRIKGLHLELVAEFLLEKGF